ncbi:MAG: hypothetical protein HGB18_05270 [Candidatus Moranbacteria bacterium]|nr:hypothetical protein [Candidatus Moranbacteria bacterium]
MKPLDERTSKIDNRSTRWQDLLTKARGFHERPRTLKRFIIKELAIASAIMVGMVLNNATQDDWILFISSFMIFFPALTVGAAKSGYE